MKIRIYQINSDRDEHRMMFLSHDRLERFQGSPEVDSKIYDKVYDKEVDCSNLEEVYTLLNIHHPSDYRGRSYAPAESEKFLSLPKELAQKYEAQFKLPERFFKQGDNIIAVPYKPKSKEYER